MSKQIEKKSLVGLLPEEIAGVLAEWGEPAYRGQQIYTWIHHHRVGDFGEMSNLPKSLRQQLAERFSLYTLQLASRQVSADGTEKYLWKLADGRFVESVLIPEKNRMTLCISSQVGCALGCHFCATGQMGFIRNLSAGEIVEQVLQVQNLIDRRLTNVVFMGMGEPFLNYPRVVQACRILGDPEGAAIANKRITISTSGIPRKIREFADGGYPYGLAISLHAPTQELRRQIMPLADKFPLDELMESAHYYARRQKRIRLTFEYVLLKDINDSPRHARQLIKLLGGLRCKLNVIPCNENNLGFSAPSEERIMEFLAELQRAPFTVTLRQNRGQDITAACGQLAVEVSDAERRRFLEVKTRVSL